MMADSPVQLTSSGPPTTVLPEPDPQAAAALEGAGSDKDSLAEVVGRYPRFVDAWAALGAVTSDPVERYAYFRVGYHRGLDFLRANGWRGSGYVRWQETTNRGFLNTLSGLRDAAAAIDETDEVDRITDFLHQLDPDTNPATD